MKMNNKVWIALILVASAVTVAFAAENVKHVTVSDLAGIVDVKKAGTDAWVPAQKGMKLTSGDAIKTTIDSGADLVFEDGSVIRLDEETSLGVEDLSENVEKARFLYVFDRNVTAKKTKFKLDEGNIMAAVKEVGNSKSQFTVQTPKGIAGVRGTNWRIGQDSLAVTSGFIDWLPKSKMNTDGSGNWFAGFREAIAGGKGQEWLAQNYDRINEGVKAALAGNGDISEFRIIDESMARAINNFVAARLGPEATDTKTGADAKAYASDVYGPTGAGSLGQMYGSIQQQEASEFRAVEGTSDRGGEQGGVKWRWVENYPYGGYWEPY